MSISQPGKDVNTRKKGYVIMLKNITEFKELDSAKRLLFQPFRMNSKHLSRLL